MTLRAHLVRGVVGTLGLTVTSAGLAFLNGILLARLLGAAGYGVYASVTAIVIILTFTLTLGFDRLVLRDAASLGSRGEWGPVRGLVQRAFQIVLVASAAGALVVGLSATLASGGITNDFVAVLWIGLLIVPLADLITIRQALTLGLQRIVSAQLPEGILRPLTFSVLLGGALLLQADSDPRLAMALNVVATASALLVGLAILWRQLPRGLREATPQFDTRRWIGEAIPFALLAAVHTFVVQIDVILVAALAGAEEAGLYSVAARGASLALFGAAAVGVTLGPTISRLWNEDDLGRLRLAVTRGSRGAFAFALAVAIGMFVFGEQFLLLFGHEFVAADDTLILLAICQVVDVGLGMGGIILGMTGHQSIALRAGVVAAVVRVAIGVALIPSYGANGAAIAAIASMAAFNGLMATYVIRRLRIDPTPLGLPVAR